MRHVLGLFGLVAATALLAVSAAMNWQFGFSLGKTGFDGQVYGLASVAADGLKALIPFLVIYALKTRKYTQALAGLSLGLICTAYSLTSSLGFSALNRADTTAGRAQQAALYHDSRTEHKRLSDKLAWMPKHRPAATVKADIASVMTMSVRVRGKGRMSVEKATQNCSLSNWFARKYCPRIFELRKELAIAEEAKQTELRITALNQQLSQAARTKAATKADPQAEILSLLTGLDMEKVQMALIILVSLLVEAGSVLGFFVVFSLWRMEPNGKGAVVKKVANNKDQPTDNSVRVHTELDCQPKQLLPGDQLKQLTGSDSLLQLTEHQQRAGEKKETGRYQNMVSGDRHDATELPEDGEDVLTSSNDNDVHKDRVLLPKGELERFKEECLEGFEGASTTATDLYEGYCRWCADNQSKPMAFPTFGRQFSEFNIKKAKIAGRIRYIGIQFKAEQSPGALKDKKIMVA